MSLHQQVVEFVTKARAIPRKEGHGKVFLCPVCHNDVKALKAVHHIEKAHREHAGALTCTAPAKKVTALPAAS